MHRWVPQGSISHYRSLMLGAISSVSQPHEHCVCIAGLRLKQPWTQSSSQEDISNNVCQHDSVFKSLKLHGLRVHNMVFKWPNAVDAVWYMRWNWRNEGNRHYGWCCSCALNASFSSMHREAVIMMPSSTVPLLQIHP